MIFDTHAHYDDEQFDGDRESLLESMVENGVGTDVFSDIRLPSNLNHPKYLISPFHFYTIT